MKNLLFIFVLIASFCNVYSQDTEQKSKIEYEIGSYLVSSYLWRGVIFDPLPNVQPYCYATFAKHLKVGFSGSYNFTGSYGAPYFYTTLQFGRFSANFADYFANGGNEFFNFDGKTTGHLVEGYLKWAESERFPMQFVASVMFYGADKKVIEYLPLTNHAVLSDANNFSTYFEATYVRAIKKGSIHFTAGLTGSESYLYGTKNLGFTNLSVTAYKEICITEKFKLPLFTSLILNPETRHTHVVFGISIF